MKYLSRSCRLCPRQLFVEEVVGATINYECDCNNYSVRLKHPRNVKLCENFVYNKIFHINIYYVSYLNSNVEEIDFYQAGFFVEGKGYQFIYYSKEEIIKKNLFFDPHKPENILNKLKSLMLFT